MTVAEIATRELMPIQEVKDMWLGSVSSETGESSHKVQENVIYDLRDLDELLLVVVGQGYGNYISHSSLLS